MFAGSRSSGGRSSIMSGVFSGGRISGLSGLSHHSGEPVEQLLSQLGRRLAQVEARLPQVEEENAELRRRVDVMQRELLKTQEGMGRSFADRCWLDLSSALRVTSMVHGSINLGSEYLLFNQMAYAIAALPIGTILSIGPLFLKNELNVPVSAIGYVMMSGELLGIIFMKWAELSFEGWVFRRPHDVHFILFSVAVFLFTMPLWPARVWPCAAGAMMLVQAFNSASKPVVAEALYRLAVLLNHDPSIVFARANKWRRMGNAAVGASTPLIYMLSPYAGFFVSSPILVIFTFAMYRCKKKVDVALERMHPAREKLKEGFATSPSQFRSLAGLPKISFKKKKDSKAEDLEEMPAGGEASIQSGVSSTGIKRMSTLSKLASLHQDDPTQNVDSDFATDGLDLGEQSAWFLCLLFLTVHAFPFMDAFISRLPFAFLTIAIMDESGALWMACVVLFSYQSCRAIGQSVQTYGVSNAVNYILTSVSVVAYASVVVCVVVLPDFGFWFVPIIPTGLSETMPAQQFYLGRLLGLCGEGSRNSQKEVMREYVKKSHTGTGIGSAAAFFTSAFVYARFGVLGFGLLGEAVALTKLGLVVLIGSSLSSAGMRDNACEGVQEEQLGQTSAEPLEWPDSFESDKFQDLCSI